MLIISVFSRKVLNYRLSKTLPTPGRGFEIQYLIKYLIFIFFYLYCYIDNVKMPRLSKNARDEIKIRAGIMSAFRKKTPQLVKVARPRPRKPRIATETTVKSLAPDGKIVRVPYCDKLVGLISTTGVHQFNSYMLNYLYDPDYSNGGSNHQPYGFDQLATFYERSIVLEAVVTATFRWTTWDTNYLDVLAYVIVDDDTSLPTTVDLKQERYGNRVCKVFGAATGNQMVTIRTTYNASKWFHIPQKSLTADHQMYSINSGGAPTKPVYCHVGIQTLDGVSTSASSDVDVRIEFRARMLDLKSVAGS